MKVLKEELRFLHEAQFEANIDFDWNEIGFETVEVDNLLFSVEKDAETILTPEALDAFVDPSLPPRAKL